MITKISTATLELATSRGNMEVYEARPEGGGPHAAVILLMEMFGLTDHIKDVAKRVAKGGYVAVAPDLYYGEAVRLIPYTEIPRAIPFMNRLQAQGPLVMDDIGVVLSHLKERSDVRRGSIGILGFCMGGRFAYLAAAHHALQAAVAFYGGGIPSGDSSPLERTGEIGCPIALFFGDRDHAIPHEDVEKVRTALTNEKKDFLIKVYPGAPHSFFCDVRPERYQPEAARDAWETTKAFFSRHLG